MSEGNKGFVYLVGAGPGRADLITVRGAELLKTADCIIYDKLANPALLSYVGPDAEILHVPKRISGRSFTQDEINSLLVEKANEGKTVVRLKGGDPCIFGRGSEEARVLVQAGVDFEIVPGVTAAIAAAEYSGVMLTDRNFSSQVAFITGHEADGKQESSIDWNVLARFPGSIVFYMGMGGLQFITDQLIQNGMNKETPAAVIANATFPNQRMTKSTVEGIDDKCRQENIGPPAIVVIGEAAVGDTSLNWFMKQPLFGKTIVSTRDHRGNADFAAKIIHRAGNPVEFPTIKIEPLTDTTEFLQALTKFSEYDWIIFTSANGVRIFFDYIQTLSKDARVFASAKIAAIGPKTADALARFGIKPDFIPDVFTGKELGKQLMDFTNLKGRKVLLLRSQLASNELVDVLQQADAEVDNVPVYTAVTAKTDAAPLTKQISDGTVDWLTFASPSSVTAFFEQIQPDLVNSADVRVASIGPVTSEQLKKIGVKIDLQAAEHTIDGLLDAIEQDRISKT
ncbi:MAG: uroporphyrinogen-III C-methyltransferase [Planctomycetota bacterium]|jgi:uroporphyrinogen III methyltransferase/synthase